MNKKTKIVCLLTLIAGWAVAGGQVFWPDINHLIFHAQIDDGVDSGQEQHATELVVFCLEKTKEMLALSADVNGSTVLEYSIPELLGYVSQFYKVSSFYAPENTQGLRNIRDLFGVLKAQIITFLYSELNELIEADVEAIKESCKETVCNHYDYDSDGEEYCYSYVDNYTNDMYDKVNAFRDAKRKEFIEERYGSQIEEIVTLIDEILGDYIAQDEQA